MAGADYRSGFKSLGTMGESTVDDMGRTRQIFDIATVKWGFVCVGTNELLVSFFRSF